MAKEIFYTADVDPKLLASKQSSSQGTKTPAVVAGILLAIYVAAAFFVPDLPMILQRLAGIVCAILAVTTYVLATRIIVPRDKLLGMLRDGASAEEIHRVTNPPQRSLQLPLVGEVTFRLLGGIGLFLLVAGCWFTSLAPIQVKRPEIKDLTVPFAQEIAGASLAFSGRTIATPLPPVVPSQASKMARHIDKDAGNAYHLGLKAIAEGRFAEARDFLADAAKSRTSQSAQVQLLQAQNEMFAGRFADAAEQYAKLLQATPDNPMLLCQAAVAQMQAGQYAQAKPLIEQIVKLAEEGKIPQTGTEWGVCLHVQAVFNAAMGIKHDESKKECFNARELFEKPLGAKHPLMAASLNNQAVLFAIGANYAGAEQLDKNAQEIWIESFDAKHPLVAGSGYNLTMILLAQGRYADARQAIDASREICDETLPEEHLLQAVIQHALAAVQLAQGQYAEALASGEQSLALAEKILGIDNPHLAPIADTLGDIYAEQGLYTKAKSSYLRALRIGKAAWGPKHPGLIPPLCHLARLHLTLGQTDEAKATCNEAFQIAEETLNDDHSVLASVLNLRAVIEIQTGDPRDARGDLDKAQEIREKLDKDHPDAIRTRADQAALNNSPHTFGRGVTEYNKAIGELKKHLGENHPEIADLLCRVANLYFQQGKFDEADSCLIRAQTIQEETLPEYHPKLAKTLELRAAVLAKKAPNDVAGVAALRNQANAIRAKHAKIDQAPEQK